MPLDVRLAKRERLHNNAHVHVPDGFLDLRTCVGTFCVAGAGLTWAARQVNARWEDKTVPLMGVMSAFLFAGQMINFPIAAGTSGHLMGGTLAAIFLGPWAAALVLATVLLVQCFLFQDGGVTALGANWLNLGFVGVLAGYFVYRQVSYWCRGPHGTAVAAGIAGWVSVAASSAVCSLELAGAGVAALNRILPPMLLSHSLIGIVEGLITGAVVSFILKVRPDLRYEPCRESKAGQPPGHSFPSWLGCGLAAAFGAALLLSPLASSLPDGLEVVTSQLGFSESGHFFAFAPFADYTIPEIRLGWLATSLAGGLGTLLALAMASGLARWLRRP